jgi:RNA polymerase sigma-70 factor (ECF subfamily)
VNEVEHQVVTEKFITACAIGDLHALAAVLDPRVWGVATFLGDPTPPPQINHGRDVVAPNLLRFLSRGTLVTAPVGEPVVFAYANRRLVAVLVLTVRDDLIL